MEDWKKKFVERMVEAKKREENGKFGSFIIQSNEVQFYLQLLILIRSGFADKDYEKYLFERSELGGLINLFNASAKKDPGEFALYRLLKKYNKERNRLAHKMYSKRKLTVNECELAINDGKKIISALKHILKERLGDFEKIDLGKTV